MTDLTAPDKVLESTARIQYQDCDPFHHLNNSRYIDYMMAARTEQLAAQYGLDASVLARSEGVGWVAAHTQIAYFRPASWMELVAIESRLIRYSASSLLVEALMWDEQKTGLKALMWAKLVHFHIGTQKSHRHGADLMALFGAILDPPAVGQSFEERMTSLRR